MNWLLLARVSQTTGLLKGGAPEYLFRFLRMYRIVTGTSEIQRNTIAKSLLRPTNS